jgi:hypothetical protein
VTELNRREMNVFVSWSGERSGLLARALADLLPDVFQDLGTWMSEHDIDAGARWGHELHRQLEASNFGVLCLTPENVSSAWLLFEAGSLAKSVSEGRVVPYLLNMSAKDVPLPLAQFQGVDANEVGTRKLIESLNKERAHPMESDRLNRIFQRWWPDLETRIRAIPAALNAPGVRIGDLPANVFWLGHDLARAIRFAMFETTKRDELERNLTQALHHLEQIGLAAPDARRFLLKAIKTHRRSGELSDVARKDLVNELAKAKNEVGDRIARLQPGFRGYPTLEDLGKFEQDIQEA